MLELQTGENVRRENAIVVADPSSAPPMIRLADAATSGDPLPSDRKAGQEDSGIGTFVRTSDPAGPGSDGPSPGRPPAPHKLILSPALRVRLDQVSRDRDRRTETV